MKIYCIRDRMIDYLMQPFVAPDDKSVLSAVAGRVNQEMDPRNLDAITQAPHHFEIWKLGEVTDEGNLVPGKEFLADCASLIRAGIRTSQQASGRNPAPEGAFNESRRPPSGDRSNPGTQPAPLGKPAHAETGSHSATHPGSQRSHQHADA